MPPRLTAHSSSLACQLLDSCRARLTHTHTHTHTHTRSVTRASSRLARAWQDKGVGKIATPTPPNTVRCPPSLGKAATLNNDGKPPKEPGWESLRLYRKRILPTAGLPELCPVALHVCVCVCVCVYARVPPSQIR
ncbi:hypothetical protein LX32DRAFT_646339 [Colletotrichum zoysiae]|uniref:Uncharacterized protein n=1 Tax=Colletotrichum zoysiae TaxID=1216348 RepID=A0AAD9H599_9PEZI|nr:hypothetical protein LX32DRAFT_646339 [Colletotrichum zoysiae]